MLERSLAVSPPERPGHSLDSGVGEKGLGVLKAIRPRHGSH